MKMGCPTADGALHNFRNTGSCIMSRCKESCQQNTRQTHEEQRPLDIAKGWPITPRMKKMAGARKQASPKNTNGSASLFTTKIKWPDRGRWDEQQLMVHCATSRKSGSRTVNWGEESFTGYCKRMVDSLHRERRLLVLRNRFLRRTRTDQQLYSQRKRCLAEEDRMLNS